jgi:hypothetical protein
MTAVGCGKGGSDVSGVPGSHTLTHAGALDSVEECPNGGVSLEHGFDKDGNGTLSADEVTDTYALCNGQDGAASGLEDVEARLGEAETKLMTLQADYDALKGDYEALVLRADGVDLTLNEHATGLMAKANSVDLATVALSGAYADLSDAPDISGFAFQVDVDALSAEVGTKANSAALADYVSTTIFESTLASFVTTSSLSAVAFSGAYVDIIGAPDITSYVVASDLAEVAYTGNYGDLTDKPDLGVLVAQSELAPVALSGDYVDLSNTPLPYTLPSDLNALNDYLYVDPSSNYIEITGANFYLTDGSGQTACLNESALPDNSSCNGLGNLVIGYGENASIFGRTGSHNLVTGIDHGWTGFGGILSGQLNVQAAAYGSVLGGRGNYVSGDQATIAGGESNSAHGERSVVSGGKENTAIGSQSVAIGGRLNSVTSLRGLVAGGAGGSATANSSVVIGGASNDATGEFTVVIGGSDNEASGLHSTVLGGQFGLAFGMWSTLGGGLNGSTLFNHETQP